MNIETNKPIVHIGLQKTGSSYLQKFILRDLAENIGYTYINDSEYFYNVKKACVVYDHQNDQALKRHFTSHGRYILSYEGLIGNLPEEWEKSAEWIKDIFGDVAIIVTVRDPYQYLNSLFLQKVKEGQFLYENEFLAVHYRRASLGCGKRAFSILDFDYSRLKEIYESKFGEVYFIPFESLLGNRIYINGEALTFETHSPLNRSLSRMSVKLIRFFGNNFPRLSRIFNENMNFDDFIRLGSQESKVWTKPRLSYSFFTRRLIDKFFKGARYVPTFDFTPDQVIHMDRQRTIYQSFLDKY